MHRQDIIDTFERIEEAAGGKDKAVLIDVLNKTVKALKMDRKDVIRVLVDHWWMEANGDADKDNP
jgi:hypothetical protein